MNEVLEILVYLLPSAGVIGSVLAAFLNRALVKARRDADIYREERIKAELLRLECDQKTMRFLKVLVRYCTDKCDEDTLLQAEQEYRIAFEKINEHHREVSVRMRNA